MSLRKQSILIQSRHTVSWSQKEIFNNEIKAPKVKNFYENIRTRALSKKSKYKEECNGTGVGIAKITQKPDLEESLLRIVTVAKQLKGINDNNSEAGSSNSSIISYYDKNERKQNVAN